MNALKLINSTHIASGSDDKTVKIWDYTIFNCILTLNTPDKVFSLALLDNNFLAAGCDGAFDIYVWNLNDGSLIATLNGHTGKVNTLETLNDGTLASGGDDSTVRLWDQINFSLLHTYTASAHVNCIRQLANGYLAIALNVNSNNLVIWDPFSKAVKNVVNAHSFSVLAVEELNNGYFTTSSSGAYVRVWNETFLNLVKTFTSHTKKVNALKSLTNGVFASASDDNTIKIWNSNDMSMIIDLTYPADIHYNALEVLGNSVFKKGSN